MADQTPRSEVVAIPISEETVTPQQPQQQQNQQNHQQQHQLQQQPSHNQQQEKPKRKSKTRNLLAINLNGAKSKSAAMRIITFILSLPLVGIVIFLLYHGDCDCESLVGLRNFRIWIIIGLIVVFILTLLAVILKDMYVLPWCLAAMLGFIIFFIIGIGLVSTVQYEGRSTTASPAWIVRRVNRIFYWNDIKHCIYETRDCDDLIAMSVALKSYDYTGLRLSSIQSGCCKPPQICEMEFVNATYWKKTVIGNIYVHKDNPYFGDCDTWQNNSTVLCYDCQSCKDAYSSLLGWKWRKLGVFLVTISTLLFLSHVFLIIFTIWERYSG